METIQNLLKETKESSPRLSVCSDSERSNLLLEIAAVLSENENEILAENLKDQEQLPDSDPKKDRLRLNPARIQDLVTGLKQVAALPDPTQTVYSERKLPNGLRISKIAVPLGVVGIIYESRPNVTVDVSALCLRSGNAVVLKGGKEAERSNRALVACIHKALEKQGLPPEMVRLLPSDRSVVQEMFTATRFLDVLIPRGSDQLISFVRQNSLVPTIETGAGVVHTYIHSTADKEMAASIVVNAKTTRPAVCNALDCLLVDESRKEDLLPEIARKLLPFGVRIHADPGSYAVLKALDYPGLSEANEGDFGREWLDFDLSVRLVSGPDEAMNHIATYSSRHSEAVVAKDPTVIERFLNEVDAAAVYANASTRFTDGGEFGLGAEIGISTQKLHARGPFALEKLVTEKWVVRGNGQIRM